MSRTIVYYYDYRHPKSGNRERFILRPGYDGYRTLDAAPVWGDLVGNATWKPLPAGFLKAQSASEFKYDALPMGMFDPATRSFRFDLLLLYEAGDTDLEAVAHYLTDTPTVSRTFDLNDIVEPLTAVMDATNAFTVLSDLGNASASITAFSVKFHGVQERQIERPMVVTAAQVIIDITAIDLVRAAATIVTPQHVYDHVTATDYTVIQKRYVYSTVYTDSGNWFIHCYGTPGGGAYQLHWAYQMSDLWVALGWLIQSVMRAMLADSAFGFVFDSDGATASQQGPTSLLSLYDQSYDPDGTNGGDEITDEVMFIGKITMSDTGDPVGGWYHSGSPDGLHRYSTLWDALKDAAEGHCTRARIQLEQDEIVVLFTSLEYESAITLTVHVPDTTGGKQEPIPGKELIVRAESDIPDATGADVGQFRRQAIGTDEDDGRTIPRWFHCQPFVGAEGEVTDGGEVTYIHRKTGDDDFDVFPGPAVGILQLTWPVNTMIYNAVGIVGSEDILIRCHHRVKVYTGNLSTPLSDDCTDAITPGLPTALDPDTIPSGSTPASETLRREQIRDDFWRKYRLSMIPTQRTAGVPLAVCTQVVRLFSRWTQYGVDIAVPASEAIPDALGGCADLDLPAWLTMGDFFDGFNSKAFLTSISENAEEDTATVTLIAPGVA